MSCIQEDAEELRGWGDGIGGTGSKNCDAGVVETGGISDRNRRVAG